MELTFHHCKTEKSLRKADVGHAWEMVLEFQKHQELYGNVGDSLRASGKSSETKKTHETLDTASLVTKKSCAPCQSFKNVYYWFVFLQLIVIFWPN